MDDEARNKQRREEKFRREEAVAEFLSICDTLDMNYHRFAEEIGWGEELRHYDGMHQLVEVVEQKEELVSVVEEEVKM